MYTEILPRRTFYWAGYWASWAPLAASKWAAAAVRSVYLLSCSAEPRHQRLRALDLAQPRVELKILRVDFIHPSSDLCADIRDLVLVVPVRRNMVCQLVQVGKLHSFGAQFLSIKNHIAVGCVDPCEVDLRTAVRVSIPLPQRQA